MNPESLLTPAQAVNFLHNLRRLKDGYNTQTLSGFCAELVGPDAAGRLAIILNGLANGTDVHVTLGNGEHPPVLGLLHALSIAGVDVIAHNKVTFYSINRAKLFEQIHTIWKVPYSWASQLIVRQPVTQQSYTVYIQSARWKLTREAVLRRDKKRCVRCGGTYRLQVHHTTYAHFGDEPLDDLITLCDECHDLEHPGRKVRSARAVEVKRG